MEEYNFDIEYIKGNENVVADALSRINLKGFSHIVEANVITRAKAKLLQPVCPSKVTDQENVKQPIN